MIILESFYSRGCFNKKCMVVGKVKYKFEYKQKVKIQLTTKIYTGVPDLRTSYVPRDRSKVDITLRVLFSTTTSITSLSLLTGYDENTLLQNETMEMLRKNMEPLHTQLNPNNNNEYKAFKMMNVTVTNHKRAAEHMKFVPVTGCS